MIIPVVYPLNMRGVVAVNKSNQLGLITTPTKQGDPPHYQGITPDGEKWVATAPSIVGRLETWLAVGPTTVAFPDWCKMRGCTAYVPPHAGPRFIEEMVKK